MTYVWLMAGGALGVLGRYLLAGWIDRHGGTFPWGIFVVNVVGCLAAGALAGAVASGRLALSPTMRVFVFTGILGGFTTFSAFGLDTHALARGGDWGGVLVNVVGQVGVGMMAVGVGFLLSGGR